MCNTDWGFKTLHCGWSLVHLEIHKIYLLFSWSPLQSRSAFWLIDFRKQLREFFKLQNEFQTFVHYSSFCLVDYLDCFVSKFAVFYYIAQTPAYYCCGLRCLLSRFFLLKTCSIQLRTVEDYEYVVFHMLSDKDRIKYLNHYLHE